MKILLIQPPIRDFYKTAIRTQPIGLAYLASSLRNHGHDVKILDCQTERRRSVPIPPELSYLREYYPFHDRSPFKLYTGFYHFGMDWGEIRRRIDASEADLFGISSSFTPYHGEALEIARIVKEGDGNRIVVMGGSHASSDPEGVLRSPFVDYVVLGEGEIRFPLLLEKMRNRKADPLKGIDGIGYRDKEEIRVNPVQNFIEALDHLPHPARNLLDPDRYGTKKKRSTMLITSRGCPPHWVDCSARLVMGDSFRPRSALAVVEEMKECWKRYGISAFDIEDDNFTFDRARAKKLLRLMIETFGEGALELSAMNGVSFASLDRELIELMGKAGFHTLNLSFVSTDLFTKESVRRPKAAVEFEEILDEAGRIGLDIIAYGIFGMPGQSVEEMVDTLIHLMGKRVLIGPSIYYPAPGTVLFEKCRREGILPRHLSQWRSSAFPIQTAAFSRIDLVTLFRLARIINFIKGRMDEGELREGVTWKELLGTLKEKVRVEVKDKVEKEIGIKTGPQRPVLFASGNGDQVTSWKDLIILTVKERSFFSLRRDSDGKIRVTKEEGSRKVLDRFLEKAWESPILKSRHRRSHL